MDITYRFWEDDAALFGPDPENLEGVDIKASYASYKIAIYNAIQKEYPQATITVSTGSPDGVFVDEYDVSPYSKENEAEVAYVEEIIHKTWEAWDWVVYK